MNQIILKGVIDNIEYSHTINNIEYNKADLIVLKEGADYDILPLRFKAYNNTYMNGQQIILMGNVRSYSEQIEGGKNKVHLYVFTYFDIPEEEFANDLLVDGRICKIENIRVSKLGRSHLHFILANNIISEKSHQKLNTYLPCVAFGDVAETLANLQVSDQIQIHGKLNSRKYIKKYSDGSEEEKIAYEVLVYDFERL